jgi:ADP-heptose:LPS heptosyltransferase
MNIAVLRALQLGDLLCAVPAFRALRAAFPAAAITLVGLAWASGFAARFGRYIDELVEFPGFPGTPQFFRRMRRRRFDLVVQMHGDGTRTNTIAERMGGRRTGGFYRGWNHCPDEQTFVEWDERENEVLRCLRLADKLGAPARGAELEFPLAPADWAEWRALALSNYVCLHPGSQLPSRRWPPERFALIGDMLAARGWTVVLTGSAGEAPLTAAVAGAMDAQAVDLAGKTSLGGLGALIARARLVVCNDTGVSHIAAALRTPSVVVCSGADPQRWAPLDRELHRVLHHDVPCRPCLYSECPIGHPCALGVSSGMVIDEVSRMLACAG